MRKPTSATLKKIEREIAEMSKNDRFLPAEYRRLRLAGRTPDKIGYDECHVWR